MIREKFSSHLYLTGVSFVRCWGHVLTDCWICADVCLWITSSYWRPSADPTQHIWRREENEAHDFVFFFVFFWNATNLSSTIYSSLTHGILNCLLLAISGVTTPRALPPRSYLSRLSVFTEGKKKKRDGSFVASPADVFVGWKKKRRDEKRPVLSFSAIKFLFRLCRTVLNFQLGKVHSACPNENWNWVLE